MTTKQKNMAAIVGIGILAFLLLKKKKKLVTSIVTTDPVGTGDSSGGGFVTDEQREDFFGADEKAAYDDVIRVGWNTSSMAGVVTRNRIVSGFL